MIVYQNQKDKLIVNIEGKVAVITGGAAGLGRATAENFIAKGGKVAVLDLNKDLVEQTAVELVDAKAYQVMLQVMIW